MKAIIFLYHQKPLIGIKGRIQSRLVEKNDTKENQIQIIAEKVTFLSSKKED